MQIPPPWRRLLRFAFWVGTGGLILVSLTPGKMMPKIGLDVLYHGVAYAGLALLAILGHVSKRTARLTMAGLVGLGIVLEFAQKLVPGRTATLEDALANTAGVCIVAVLWQGYLRSRQAPER